MAYNQKEIAVELDRAASRADLVNAAPATAKQSWYLAGLLVQLGRDAAWVGCEITNSNAILTKKRASGYISDLLADVQKLRA